MYHRVELIHNILMYNSRPKDDSENYRFDSQINAYLMYVLFFINNHA